MYLAQKYRTKITHYYLYIRKHQKTPNQTDPVNQLHRAHSVPARLGKGQGAKEIGHNLARERPKFEHNLVCKSFTRERPKFGLVGD